jgi:AAA lid domain
MCVSLSLSDRRGSVGSGMTSSRMGIGSAASKLPKKDAIKVLLVCDLHTLSRQAQLELSLLLLSDSYSIPTIFLVTGVEHPLQSLRYSLRGKFRISATIACSQLVELQSANFVHRIEQDRLERLRCSIAEPGSVEFCLELEAYVHDVVFGLRNQPDGTCGSVRFPSSTLKTLSRAVAAIAGRDFVVPEDVHDAALLFLPLAFRSSQMQITDILNV